VAGPPFLNNLETMEAGNGYWIQMSESGGLSLVSIGMADDPIGLKFGWNLVGYNCTIEQERDNALRSMNPYLKAVWAYEATDEGWKRYMVGEPGFLNNLLIMKPKLGYWIDVTEDCVWDANCPVPLAAPPIATATQENYVSSNRPEIPYTIWGSVQMDNMDMAENFNIEALLKVGDEILSHCQLSMNRYYGIVYALDVPVNADFYSFPQLHIQVDSIEVKVVPIPLGDPGEVIRFDLSIQAPPLYSQLHQNYTNPLNPGTWIPYELSEGINAVISIYSSTGELVRTLDLGYRPAGFYSSEDKSAYWDGKNESDERVASGAYFAILKVGEDQQIRRMILLK